MSVTCGRELLHCDLEGVQQRPEEAAGVAAEARGGAHTALVDAYATARLFCLPYVIYLCFVAGRGITRIVSIYQVIGRIRYLRRRTAKKRRALRREQRAAARLAAGAAGGGSGGQ